jgi:hypothetical protein
MTRPVYETLLRRLLLSTCTNVEYLTGTVTSLQPASSGWDNITSVSVKTISDEKLLLISTSFVVGTPDLTGWHPDG